MWPTYSQKMSSQSPTYLKNHRWCSANHLRCPPNYHSVNTKSLATDSVCCQGAAILGMPLVRVWLDV